MSEIWWVDIIFFKSLIFLKHDFFRGSFQGNSDVNEWKQYSFAWLWIKLLNSAGATSEPHRERLMGKML